MHASREPLYEFYREARIGADIHLRGLLEALPPGSVAFLFADHGFVEDPAYRPERRYQAARYTHGGGRILEVLAPTAAVHRVG